MGTLIHAKKSEDGIRFRMWTTYADTYVTPEMTEAQVVRWLVEDDIQRALRDAGREIERRIGRARATGTSAFDGPRGLGDWDECRELGVCQDDDPEEHIDGEFEWILTPDVWRKSATPVTIDGKQVRVTVKIELVDPA
jgi:hypothetical protein